MKEKAEKQTSPENQDEEDAHCIAAAEKTEELENKNWKVWRTSELKEKVIMGTITQKETTEKKLYPIFNAAKIKVKIKEPKLNTQQAESAEFQETDDAHCIEAARAAENAEKMGGVPHWGLFLS